MLSKKIYTQEYISVLRGRTGDDPLMIERTLFAFGLLEAIKRVDMPFVFKGGTSLSKAYALIERFSEDIDLSMNRKLTESEKKKRLLVSIIL